MHSDTKPKWRKDRSFNRQAKNFHLLLGPFLDAFIHSICYSFCKAIPRKMNAFDRPCWQHNAKWWYSTVHITVLMIGAGVVALPAAMKDLNWWPGMLMLGACWIITACTMWQIIQLHEFEGQTFDSFADLGKLLGIRGGREIMFALQMTVQVTANIAYMVTGGFALKLFSYPESRRKLDFLWTLIFGVLQCLLSLIASFSTMTLVNLIGTLTAIGYSTIIWASALKLSPVKDNPPEYHASRAFYQQANAIGVIAFAFGGQNILLDIQASMRSLPEKPSKNPMWNGVVVAYLIVAFCYFPVAAIGYHVFQHNCFYNIFSVLLSDSQDDMTTNGAVRAALIMLVVHLLGSYQIYALPVYEWLESRLEMVHRENLSIITRPAYVALTCITAIVFPFFNEMIGIIGGLALGPSCYIMPCVIWIRVKKPKMFSPVWLANMVSILFGLAVMLMAIIGGFGSLIDGFQHNKLAVFHFPNSTCPVT